MLAYMKLASDKVCVSIAAASYGPPSKYMRLISCAATLRVILIILGNCLKFYKCIMITFYHVLDV